MRSQGVGVIKIESQQSTKVNDFLTLLDPGTPKIKPGMYIFNIDRSTRDSLEVRFKTHGKGGGVHEAFWKSFCDFLNELSQQAASSEAVDAGEMVSGSSEICEAISGTRDRSGSWLSTMRNEINYQHKHAVWFPTKKTNKFEELIGAVQFMPSSACILGSPISRKPVQAFIETCSFLACLSYEIAEFIAARSTKGGAFGQKWRRIKAQIC